MKSQFDTGLKITSFCLLLIGLSISCAHMGFSRTCKPENLQFKDSNFQVQALRYSPQKPATKTILIIPPTGGTNALDKSYASLFCQNDYQVFVLSSWTGHHETDISFEVHQRFYSNAQKAISLVLKNVNTPFVGLIGTSVGGLHASVAASLQDQIDAVFTITAGTPIAEVVVFSKQEAMQDLNKKRKEKFNTLSDQDQIDRIEKAFHLEPSKLKSTFQKKQLGLAMATQDTVVPTVQQEKLKDLWKPKVVIEMKNDHFWGIVKTWLFHSDDILNFFNDANHEKTSSRKVPKTEH